MGDRLLPLSLTERSVHLCVDMQRLFATREVLPLELLYQISEGIGIELAFPESAGL